MINEKTSMAIHFEMIELLHGKLNLIQKQSDREEIVEGVLLDLIKDHECPDVQELLQDQEKRIIFIKEFLTYGVITDLLCDFDVEDIIINNLKPIYVHHSKSGFVCVNKRFETEESLDLFIKKLLLFCGGKSLSRIVDLELPNLGGRVNIALSAFGPQLTITRAKTTPLSVLSLIRNGAMTHEVAAQLWLYLEGLNIRPANIMITGGPGVGKTTLLNSLFSFVPESHRTVVIEDTLELNTFLEDSWARLESDEGVSLADLVKNSLRMRPERIIVGEVRGEEARDMATACNVGKYCMGTIHALTAREAIIRLQSEPMNIPEMLVNLIDVFIVLKRYHVGERVFRVVDEVSETSGMEQVKILLAQVYKYDYEKKTINSMNPSTIYRDKLSDQSGLTPKDIILEHKLRTLLLKELDERDMISMMEITTFCREYSKNPRKAIIGLGFDPEKEKSLLDILDSRP